MAENSIGSLLYHVALVEMSWLFLDVSGRPFPDEVKADFPFDMASRRGLTRITGVSLYDHVARMGRSRAVLLEHLRGMPHEDWRRLRADAPGSQP